MLNENDARILSETHEMESDTHVEEQRKRHAHVHVL